ncbi:kinase-like domain-containing protein [Thermothelomyces heterothallicus CBS 202.75]|uniref:kinase-like domain-containing protein n=1 Tax=Thermothelomyces heterothallicus CBS 202.75 TaxID=1149848 RepID=UPI0037421DF2
MASALKFVHDNGVSYNDVKPANILYRTARGAVLIDFRLSSANKQDSESLYTSGTPWYIPPEFLADPGVGRGPPGDVWALGVVVELLEKLEPRDRPTAEELLADVWFTEESPDTRDPLPGEIGHPEEAKQHGEEGP